MPTDDELWVMAAAARFFQEEGSWPDIRRLERHVIRSGGPADPYGVSLQLPSHLGFLNTQTLVLTAEGLAATGSAESLLEVLARFSAYAADVYLTADDDVVPHISRTSAGRALGFDEKTLDRLHALLNTESFVRGSGHSSAEGWEYEVPSAAARFSECRTAEDYLAIGRQLQARPVPTAQHISAELAPVATAIDGRALERLHTDIRDIAAGMGTGRSDAVVVAAFKAVEVRVRDLTGFGHLVGVRLLTPPSDLTGPSPIRRWTRVSKRGHGSCSQERSRWSETQLPIGRSIGEIRRRHSTGSVWRAA